MQIPIGAVLLVGLVYVAMAVVYGVSVDEAVSGTIEGIEGESITLICDLRDTDEEYIWFRNQNYFLTMGETVIANVPSDIANRIAVTCIDILEACYLTISPVKRSDTGEYGCGYLERNIWKSASVGQLVVLVPPADPSPQCNLSKNSILINSDMLQVGDEVGLTCIVTGGDPTPSVSIARDGVAVTSETVTGSFTYYYTLSQQDENSTFTCVMTHPALSQHLFASDFEQQ